MAEPIPLTEAPVRGRVVVEAVSMGRHFQMKLTAMGIAIGKELQVLQRNGHGPLIVALGGSRVAVGRGMAEGIMVRAIE